jgi:hypothetical protein
MPWSCCSNQSSLIVLVILMHLYPYLIGTNRENSMIINHSLVCTIRDGNGDPIPDSPRRIPLLGDRYGTNLVPAGI